MSHSPESTNANKSSQEDYVRQWYALEELIRQGESFSGKERNCAFLNTGDGRFADVSGAMSFDFNEDARSMALTDWDHDGDLDAWVRSRNAAGLRLLRNDILKTATSLSLHLTGTKGNRDAIGARVSVELGAGEGAASGKTLIKTVHAGEGFRGQSTKWIVFGLEGAGAVKAVTVRWPDGTSESFTGVTAGKRWELTEGSGAAKAAAGGNRSLRLAPGKTEIPEASGIARVLVMSQPPAPALTYTKPDASAATVAETRERPLLVNLFATWCTPCAVELKELGAKRASLEKSGVDVLALSLDALRPGDGKDAPQTDPAEFLKKVGYTGEWGAASADLLTRVQIVTQHVVDNRRPLPTPTSLLLTKDGKLGVIYLGRVTADQLAKDAKLIEGPEADRWTNITELKGRWNLFPNPSSLAGIAYAMREAGQAEEAQRYERAYAARALDDANAQAMNLMAAGKLPEAEKMLRDLVAAKPDHAPALANLGITLLMRGANAEAEAVLAKSAGLDPAAGTTQLRYGHSLQVQGKLAQAAPPLREAVRILPESKEARTRLAWVLAVNPASDAAARAEALTLAMKALQLEPASTARDIDVLAAAQAANGKHADAASTERRAIELAKKESPNLVAEFESRLKLYEGGQAYTLAPATGG